MSYRSFVKGINIGRYSYGRRQRIIRGEFEEALGSLGLSLKSINIYKSYLHLLFLCFVALYVITISVCLASGVNKLNYELFDYGCPFLRHCKTLPPALIPLISHSVSLVSVECRSESLYLLIGQCRFGSEPG